MKHTSTSRKNIEAICPCYNCKEANCPNESKCQKYIDYQTIVDEYESEVKANKDISKASRKEGKPRYKNDRSRLAKQKRTNYENLFGIED